MISVRIATNHILGASVKMTHKSWRRLLDMAMDGVIKFTTAPMPSLESKIATLGMNRRQRAVVVDVQMSVATTTNAKVVRSDRSDWHETTTILVNTTLYTFIPM